MPHLQEGVIMYFWSIAKFSILFSLLNPNIVSTLLSFITHYFTTMYISRAFYNTQNRLLPFFFLLYFIGQSKFPSFLLLLHKRVEPLFYFLGAMTTTPNFLIFSTPTSSFQQRFEYLFLTSTSRRPITMLMSSSPPPWRICF